MITSMRRWTSRLGLAAVSLTALGCALFSEPEDDGFCRRTSDFGIYGCAVFILLLDLPPEPPPALHRWSIRAISANPEYPEHALGSDPVGGRVTLEVQLRWPPPHRADTASFWLIAKILEVPSPPVTGVPLPVFAADSVLRVGRFGGTGGKPVVDTVRLHLRRPEPPS